MKNQLAVAARSFALVVLILFATWSVASSLPSNGDAPKADCAFSNQYYSGWCRKTIPLPEGSTPQQACETVLRCLNGENSVCEGNINPCHSPEIRSGWKLEEAKPSASPR